MVFLKEFLKKVDFEIKSAEDIKKNNKKITQYAELTPSYCGFAGFARVDALHPSQQLFNHVGTISCLPGLNQYKEEDKVSCSRTQLTVVSWSLAVMVRIGTPTAWVSKIV